MGVALLAHVMSLSGAELCVVGTGWSGTLFVYRTMTQVGAHCSLPLLSKDDFQAGFTNTALSMYLLRLLTIVLT